MQICGEEQVVRMEIKHMADVMMHRNREIPLFLTWSKWIEMQRYASEAMALTNGQNRSFCFQSSNS